MKKYFNKRFNNSQYIEVIWSKYYKHYKSKKGVIMMNTQRAQEIAASPVMANVTYNGVPIYIEQVDAQNGTAIIHPLNEPSNKQQVSISSLIEH
jgi:small acid-soluble spore protein H (minor)